ncbi:hypothetical protein GCM10011519_22860 [Marmoricola endophyticus]|uniref:ACT domain-containing protein n=1 Tax=Marmoricola endophyticus TaxID=2040280 RepID=A0A917BL08_9ACTN|nr:amino acid-binding protein [Marmoricola endophyticus]GGF48304.1 hypothetical protein GCM10011519_22860 [Marmoricola endophyticus]
MSWLLRVALPDVPGSLGRLATAIGWAGGDIGAIEIIEHGTDGRAVDDVFLTLEDGVMPDSVVSACHQLEDVDVLWISRYPAGGQLFLDLEVVETMTEEPSRAAEVLLEALPPAFRVDWAAQVRPSADGGRELVRRTTAAPEEVPAEVTGWPAAVEGGVRLELAGPWDDMVLAGAALGEDLVVIARRGGPAILDSEIARLRHLCALATTISRGV